MKGRWKHYSDEELAWIEERKEYPRRELHAEFCKRFGREDVNLGAIKGLCKRKGWMTGRDGRFVKGQPPSPKATAAKGWRHKNCRKTQFRTGQEPHNTKYLGHERLCKNGYVEMSVAETNPHTGYHRRYVQKHRWLWEKANGPVPECHCLKSLDGDRTNTDPANWIAIPRALLPRLTGRWNGLAYDDAPADLKPIILQAAMLDHAARERKRGKS